PSQSRGFPRISRKTRHIVTVPSVLPALTVQTRPFCVNFHLTIVPSSGAAGILPPESCGVPAARTLAVATPTGITRKITDEKTSFLLMARFGRARTHDGPVVRLEQNVRAVHLWRLLRQVQVRRLRAAAQCLHTSVRERLLRLLPGPRRRGWL